MANKLKFVGFVGPLTSVLCLLQMTSCISDESDGGTAGAGNAGTAGTAGAAGASGSAGTAGSAGSGGSGGSTNGAGGVCASPTAINSAKAAIADFDAYDGATDFKTWSFAMGNDSSNGVLAGSFAYGDRETGFPETYEMGEGHDSTYGMRISETLAETYGGGMGLWLSACLDATAFTGISFWVRGNSPSPTATFTLSMYETLTNMPTDPTGTPGGCGGSSDACVHPQFAFPVTDEWTEVKAPWSAFKAGNAAGTVVTPNGRNITQFQWGVNLNFVPSEADPNVYVPVPAPYELVVDDVTFY